MFFAKSLLFLGMAVAVMASAIPQDVDEDMLAALRLAVDETKEELRELEALSHSDDDDSARSSFKDKIKQKVKEMCNCISHKECQCCIQKEIKIPKLGETFTPKVCFFVAIEPDTKNLNVKIGFGPLTVFEKKSSFENLEEKCKKIEKFKNVELCYKMKVSESEEKGLTACLRVQANLMEIFNQPIVLPCLNFKDQKLTIDESFENYEEGGIKLNLKAIWKKFKKLIGLDKKKPEEETQ